MPPRLAIDSIANDDRSASRQCSRREFCAQSAAAISMALTPGISALASGTKEQATLPSRIEGLLIGSLIGDALGGPYEFQPSKAVHALADGPKRWRDDELLDDAAIDAAAKRVRLRGYSDLRPEPEPYAHWASQAPAGTVTDDSRHKMILLHALREFNRSNEPTFTSASLAKGYLTWPELHAIATRLEYAKIKHEWLSEISMSARWVLGVRDSSQALPPERLWNGLPTCCGQMCLPPLAAIYPGEPERAYRAAYATAFFDNGWGKDLNAAIIAGLSTALALPADAMSRRESWQAMMRTMLATDPYRYGKVPWTQRSVDRWMELVERVVEDAQGSPKKLFSRLDQEFQESIKWEAQVCFAAALAAAMICKYDPLASMQISIEWGHDADSYAQLLGAFVGALHGAEIFPEPLRDAVAKRLQADYGEDLNEWVDLLIRLRGKAQNAEIIAW